MSQGTDSGSPISGYESGNYSHCYLMDKVLSLFDIANVEHFNETLAAVRFGPPRLPWGGISRGGRRRCECALSIGPDKPSGWPWRRSAARGRRSAGLGTSRGPWRDDHGRRCRQRPQRLRSDRHADRLGYRHRFHAAGRPQAADVRGDGRGQGDRDRAGGHVPGLDLQRSRAGSGAPGDGRRTAAHRVQELRFAPALDAFPRHSRRAHGRRSRERG